MARETLALQAVGTYTRAMLFFAIVAGFAAAPVPPIYVDQFGWRPTDQKIAVFADPVIGQNAEAHFHPGDTFEVHRAGDDKVVFTGKPTAWQDGAVSKLAGDRVWHADFSSVTEPGSYYI